MKKKAKKAPRKSFPERCFLVVTLAVALLLVLGAFAYLEGEIPMLTKPKHSILFVGDVMLARSVEKRMHTYGYDYPFRRVQELFEDYDVVIGNLEVAIPEAHEPTPPGALRFSIPESFASELARAGFTVLTLANNHALDYGEEGFSNTQTELQHAGLAFAGHPTSVTDGSVHYLDIKGVRIGVIALNTTWGIPSQEALLSLLTDAERESDIQIVTVHWGEEYVPKGDHAQRTLAHTLIDNGADAIIGHHPHVVQHIERYKHAPIFYSLGNFIFDQYWDEEVQEGLAIGVHVEKGRLRYNIIPVTSADKRSAPRPMDRFERTVFLQKLADKSDTAIASDIQNGMIEISLREFASL